MEQYFKEDQPLNMQAGQLVKKEAWVDDTSLVTDQKNKQKAVKKPENPFEHIFG